MGVDGIVLAQPSRMATVVDGLGGDGALRASVEDRLTAFLARHRARAINARVLFSDESVSKGGVDIRCSLTLHVARRGELHADAVAASAALAFDQALAALERQVERDRTKSRVQRRRPKKYYLAKRLLEPEMTSEQPPAPPPPLPRRRSA